jgi:SepF-like predicted cell division protein (DUF552 family)
MNDRAFSCMAVALIIIILLILILVPLTFSYIDYYDYGLIQRKSTGSVDTSAVYSRGRYAIGPDRRFIKYQADAHLESFDQLGVFSASTSNESIGLEFWVDVDFTFFLIQDDIGLVHKELASNYRNVILSRAQEAIKNSAAKHVTFTQFFQERLKVEKLFRNAIQERWDTKPNLHCTLDQLEARVQNERNDREQFLQRAQVERELTTVEVNKIDLDTIKEIRTANAEASLIRSKASSEAQLLKSQAHINGTKLLLEAAGITSQDHRMAFDYINTLRNRAEKLNVGVSYLLEDSVIRTAPMLQG